MKVIPPTPGLLLVRRMHWGTMPVVYLSATQSFRVNGRAFLEAYAYDMTSAQRGVGAQILFTPEPAD